MSLPKPYFLPLLVATVINMGAHAAEVASLQSTTQAPVPLLWKVAGKNHTVYLLGSFHMLKPGDYPLSKDVEAAFADAEWVMFEVPPEQMNTPDLPKKVMAAAGFSDGSSLSKVLPTETRDKLEKLLAAGGGTMAQLDAYEPWFVSLSMVMTVSQAIGFRPESGLDQYLMKRAADVHKPTSGLETMDSQLQLLDSQPIAEQVLGLKEFLDQPQQMPAKLNALHAAWRAGDVDQLDVLVRQEMQKSMPVSYRRINVERNDAWMPKIEQRLNDPGKDDTLVVVGALHLLGSDGVVDKLRAKGYVVERISTACVSPASTNMAGAEGK